MARRRTKVKGKKKVSVELIPRLAGDGKPRLPYAIMDALIEANHSHLKSAKIALCWRKGWKNDRDGHIKLGQAKKASDMDRALKEYDLVILLNFEAWNESGFTEKQMNALVDHELCHCELAKDNDGEPIEDELKRACYRIRKHDVEEFQEVISRHGTWKRDLERFAEAAAKSKISGKLFEKPAVAAVA
jgi:hypothetical protein